VLADTARPLPVSAAQRDALGIEVEEVEARELVPRPHLPGRVTLPNDKVRLITARVSGVLLSPVAAVGDAVVAGQEMARVESPAFVALQREYLEALSQLDLARSTAAREEELARDGIIPGRRAAQSEALLHEARIRFEERGQTLAIAGMGPEAVDALGRARRLQSTLVLRAPLAGVVLEQYVQAGERLDAGDALYRIGDLAALAVEIHVPLDLARVLVAGTPFRIADASSGTPDAGASGRVIAIGSQVHALDQGVLVRGEIVEGAEQLRPGQFVRVQLETARQQGAAFAVPATAVVRVGERDWVFVERERGFEPTPVEVIGGSGHERVLVGPLDATTRVATSGTAALKAHWIASGGSD
jgi:RND family efflux transporter MFP subunit